MLTFFSSKPLLVYMNWNYSSPAIAEPMREPQVLNKIRPALSTRNYMLISDIGLWAFKVKREAAQTTFIAVLS